jgi:hypothetical protein
VIEQKKRFHLQKLNAHYHNFSQLFSKYWFDLHRSHSSPGWLSKTSETIAFVSLEGNINLIKPHFIERLKTIFSHLKVRVSSDESSLASSECWRIRIHVTNEISDPNHWDEYLLCIDDSGISIIIIAFISNLNIQKKTIEETPNNN